MVDSRSVPHSGGNSLKQRLHRASQFLTAVLIIYTGACSEARPECRQIFESKAEEIHSLARKLRFQKRSEKDEIPPWYWEKVWEAGEMKKKVFPIYPELRETLRGLGPRYLDLLADPGLVSHGREFIDFVVTCAEKCRDLSPFQLREEFSGRLGKIRRYRAVTVEPKVAEEIRREGFIARGIAQKKRGFLRDSLQSQIQYHVANGSSESQFISVSSYPEVAAAAANGLKNRMGAGREKIYLFKMDIPKLDLIESRAEAFNFPAIKMVKLETPEGFRIFRETDPIESFVFRKISPSYIVEISEIKLNEFRIVD